MSGFMLDPTRASASSEARREIPSESRPVMPNGLPDNRICHMCETGSHVRQPLSKYTLVKRSKRDPLHFTPVDEVWMHRACVADFLQTDEACGKIAAVAEYDIEA